MWRHFVLFACFVLGLSHAARRTRTTSTTTVAPSTSAQSEGRQLGFAGQPAELENIWDHIDIQKLDNRADSWKKDPIGSRNDTVDFGVHSTIPGRQFYPGLPGNPGDSNELPNPIATISPPQPSLPPGCLEARGQFPSPKSCANYLNCWDDVVIEQTCPNGLLFNEVDRVCDFDYNVHCGNRPLPPPKPSLTAGSRFCPDLNGRYRSSTNCSEFYVCVVGKPVKFSCPRGLVYSDILNVCDYPYNVDCQGAATPKPLPPTTYPPSSQKPSLPPQTYPPQQPSQSPPTHPPTYPPQQPSYPPQQPSYPPQQPSYPPQQPSYPPQQPSYPPQQPSYPGSSYPGNPWLTKSDSDHWHQRAGESQIDAEDHVEPEEEESEEETVSEQGSKEEDERISITNPWNVVQAVPASLSKVPCENGEVHRLNEACTSVVVCRNGRPQLVQCTTGFSYDKPSDSCRPFTLAKC